MSSVTAGDRCLGLRKVGRGQNRNAGDAGAGSPGHPRWPSGAAAHGKAIGRREDGRAVFFVRKLVVSPTESHRKWAKSAKVHGKWPKPRKFVEKLLTKHDARFFAEQLWLSGGGAPAPDGFATVAEDACGQFGDKQQARPLSETGCRSACGWISGQGWASPPP